MNAVTVMYDEFIIEELDADVLPDDELDGFMVTEPMHVLDVSRGDATNEENNSTTGALIREYLGTDNDDNSSVNNDTQSDNDNDEDEEFIDNEEEEVMREVEKIVGRNALVRAQTENLKVEPTDSEYDEFVDERMPTTSEAAAETVVSEKSVRCKHTFRKTKKLPAPLSGLMGEANIILARGKPEMAEKICLEIVRQFPFAAEPYMTLAQIYEGRDQTKYLNYLTIAAHLSPTEREQWIRLAELYIELGNLKKARFYYSKAIRIFPKDYDLRLRKARLLVQMDEIYKANLCYLFMIPCVPAEMSQFCLTTARNVAQFFHSCRKHQLALEAMNSAYGACAPMFTLEDLNIFLELLIMNKEYGKALQCLEEQWQITIQTQPHFMCDIPEELKPQIRAKLCVCLIQHYADVPLPYIVSNVQAHIPITDDFLELFVDITEALMQRGKLAEALLLLEPITDCSCVDCPAFIFLRQAECLRQMGRISEAIETYMHVVNLAPQCYDAKFTLATLLKQQGRTLEAVKALEQTVDGQILDQQQLLQPLNARLLYEHCLMLEEVGNVAEFLQVGKTLLSRHSLKLQTRDEVIALSSGICVYNPDSIRTILQRRCLNEEEQKALLSCLKPVKTDLTVQDEFELFKKLMRTAFEHKNYILMESLCFSMVTTKRFKRFFRELEYYIVLACYYNKDYTVAFSYLRFLLLRDPSNMSLWNMFGLLLQQQHDLRYYRFTNRLLQRHPELYHLKMFNASHNMTSFAYKIALSIYASIEQETPDNSLVALCIAVIFQQFSVRNKFKHKPSAATHALVFGRKYATLRARECTNSAYLAEHDFVHEQDDDDIDDIFEWDAAECAAKQEIYYNLGRLYHQSGLLHIAVEYYERALATRHKYVEDNEEILGLRQEIAYNLHLIYAGSGNLAKARQLLYEYCVV